MFGGSVGGYRVRLCLVQHAPGNTSLSALLLTRYVSMTTGGRLRDYFRLSNSPVRPLVSETPCLLLCRCRICADRHSGTQHREQLIEGMDILEIGSNLVSKSNSWCCHL